AAAQNMISTSDVTAIGQVIIGNHRGRDDAQITIFDGTGVGLQDLAVAGAVVERAKEQGKAVEVEI
ncbi:MAG: ornithine cyclodeaminase family protein, partial [Paracoccus sp. (in: a-proteobacteria)]